MEERIRINSNAGKKPRVGDTEKDGEDIISNMPETIICQILSLLPTKDAVRTCVLSKDWEYKWTGIYNIDIDDAERFSLEKTRKRSVVNFVDRIFILSPNSTLKRFCLSFEHEYDARRMITWISGALMRNVEDLEIDYNYEDVVLPRCLFDCTSLTNLKLRLPCTFSLRPVQNWFSNLKVMDLAKVKILNEYAPNTRQLIFNFPVLETFNLFECVWLKVNIVEINAPSLTKFDVRFNRPEIESFQIKISGAKLVKFEFLGTFLGNFDLSASSVFCASVDFIGHTSTFQRNRESGLHARLLLKGCSGLYQLRLTGGIVEEIARSKQGPTLPKFNMLKRLEICSKCGIDSFLEFLHSTPHLELIKLNMLHCAEYDYDSVEPIPSCILSHLKDVEFAGFMGKRPQVHLADFLLKNAVVLKKMTGLSRKRSEETQVEKNFWARLNRLSRDGDFEMGSSMKNMAWFG